MENLHLSEGTSGIDLKLWKTLAPAKGMHRHSFYELVYIYTGKGKHITEQGEYDIGPGDIFVVPPGAAHSYSDRHNVSLINIMFDMKKMPFVAELLRDEPGFHAFFATAPNVRDDFRFRNKLTLFDEDRESCEKLTHGLDYEFRSKLPAWRLNLFALLAELFVLIDRACCSKRYSGPRNLVLLDKIMLLMRAEMKKNPSIPDIAARCGVSLKTMERLFAGAMQCSPLAYLNELRLKDAAKRLLETDQTVGLIAAESGFPDSNYFTKRFRAAYSMPPREYRRLHKVKKPH